MSTHVSNANPGGLAGTTIAGLLLAAAQAPLGSTMIAVGLPAISKDLSTDVGLVTSLAVTSYLIANIICQSPSGKLGDVIGHLRTARIGMLVNAIGACVGCFAPSLLWLVLSRCTMGLGSALVVPSVLALLRTHVHEAQRGRAFGLFGSTMSLSAALGPPLGGELMSRFGWRSIFFVSLPCVALSAVLVRYASPPPALNTPSDQRTIEMLRAFDWTGTGLLAAALASLVVGSKLQSSQTTAVLVGSAAILIAFVLWELRASNPVLDPRLFKHRAFAAGSSIIALQNFGMYGLLFLLPQFFTRLRGATARDVGGLLFIMMASMFVFSAIGGRSSDRLGPRIGAIAGALLTLIGMLWLRHLEDFQKTMDAAIAVMLVGVGLGLGTAPAQAAALSAVRVEQSGMAAGATSTLRYLGSVATILMLSVILSGDAATTVSAHVSAVTAFTIATALSVTLCFMLPGKIGSASRTVGAGA
jgi:MFS family permease